MTPTRWPVLGALLGACGVREYLPEGPALGARDLAAFAVPAPSGVAYGGPPRVDFPVLPLQVWGAHYDLDLVLESTHPGYDMHEYARVTGPDGPIWLAKDARSDTRTQSIVAGVPGLHGWLPELPIERKAWPVAVTDRSTADLLDLELRYENLDGEPVVVTYAGRPPTDAQGKRNGNTMGHSASLALAVLDIPYRTFARRASIAIGGVDYPIRKLLGLVPLRVALVQTQGGFAIGRLHGAADPAGFAVRYDLATGPVDTTWSVERSPGALVARQVHPFRTLTYRWLDRDGALELAAMEVHQHGRDLPIVAVRLQPALPDVRRWFEGRVVSRFTVDLNDQPGHATGRVEARWDGDQVVVDLLPDAPEWAADRPMRSTLSYGEGVDVAIERVGR